MIGCLDLSVATSAYLELRDIALALGGKRILQSISLDIPKGELLGLLGPSGSGKTTMLNIIGGFLKPDQGELRIGGQNILGLPPHERDIGITFQGYALFPHLSVFDNVAYGLKQRRVEKREISDRVSETVAMLGLKGLERRLPKALSGGEQQRVALGRALVVRPRLMLLDEPLANLDASLRQKVRFEIREVLRRTHVTSIFVTHDQDEAFALCDRIAVLRDGKIQQIGTPPDLIRRPANAFVAGFVGCPNVFRAKAVAYDAAHRQVRVEVNGFSCVATTQVPISAGAAVEVFVRAEEITIHKAGEHLAGLPFRVRDWGYLGSGREAWLDGPIHLRARAADADDLPALGEAVIPSWPAQQAFAFEAA